MTVVYYSVYGEYFSAMINEKPVIQTTLINKKYSE